jgi:steroid 5-alpha reductase family enzyme
MNLLTNFMIAAAFVFFYMTIFFIVAVQKKDNSLADIAWGMGFVCITYLTLLIQNAFQPRQLLVTGLVTLWGLRLALYISTRNRGKGEDPRYRKWREDWGRQWIIKSYLQVFLLQGFFMLVIAASIIVVNSRTSSSLNFLDLIGSTIWLIGFIFETIGDYQLRAFIANPANHNRIMQSGLWRYTRHPNYFGEATMWWGIFVIALNTAYGILAIVSPLLITTLLLFVSGVPLLEKRYAGNPEFDKYKQQTSVFIPWFPKQRSIS